ncbi:MAG: hypothetical protein U9P79_05435 [Candidatus Cloacimonadota bacterium]|nr:hypothetical protein [Candidatus Cloacimonadota bacterium]
MKKISLAISLFVILFSTQIYAFGKNKINNQKIEWSTLKTTHFDIHYEKGLDFIGETTTLIIEDAYYRYQKLFEFSLPERVPVVIYNSHNKFEETNTLLQLIGEGTGGFTEFIKNRVVVPFDGSYKRFELTIAHELTHVFCFYTMQGGSIKNFASGMFFSMPLWFSEGIAEFCSIHGSDFNDMYMLNLVINDNLIPLERVGGYAAYREGESFLLFLESRFGTDSVFEFMYNFKVYKSIDESAKKTFNISFEDLQDEWRVYLQKRYSEKIVNNEIPSRNFQQLTKSKKLDEGNNFNPVFSPNGSDILYYTNHLFTTDIYRRSTLDLYKPKKIVQSGFRGKYENFHYMKSSISYFPDGEKFAFVIKTTTGDVISICESKKGEEIQRIKLDFDSIFEIDVSPDGEKIVLVGLVKAKNDLYIYNLKTKTISRLTNDYYDDRYPRWSSDGKKIVFSSHRFVNKIFKPQDKKYLFSNLSYNIFLYDVEKGSLSAVTNERFDNIYPTWSSDDSCLVYTSYRDGIANLYAYDFKKKGFAQLSKNFCGSFCPDISNENGDLIFSAFYKNGWNLYLSGNPLDSLEYYEHSDLTLVDKFPFSQTFQIDNFKRFYPEKSTFAKYQHDSRKSNMIPQHFPENDSIEAKPPKNAKKAPPKENYHLKFTPDFIFGGLAYDSAYGLSAQLYLAMSDLLGNHHISIISDMNKSIENSNILIDYYFLKNRMDYGVGIFNLVNDYYYLNTFQDESGQIYDGKKEERQTGFHTLFSYPVSQFNRFDFYNSVYYWQKKWYYWNNEWIHIPQENLNSYFRDDKSYIYSSSLFFTHDTSIWGYTGPIRGSRTSFGFEKSFGDDNNYLNIYSDFRKYIPISLDYQFAGRWFAGFSTGQDKGDFILGGYYNLRGYLQEEFLGNNISFASVEFRYPFIKNMQFGFPLPLWISNVRGAIFADAGRVWDKIAELENSDINETKLGYGWGTRMNMGYFVLKFDWAYRADLSIYHQKPKFYFSLNAEF